MNCAYICCLFLSVADNAAAVCGWCSHHINQMYSHVMLQKYLFQFIVIILLIFYVVSKCNLIYV